MKWFTYVAEILIDGQWASAFVLVSKPGDGMRDILDAVKNGKENECRSRRILDINEFQFFVDNELQLGVGEDYTGEEVVFENGKAIINPKWVGKENWDEAV